MGKLLGKEEKENWEEELKEGRGGGKLLFNGGGRGSLPKGEEGILKGENEFIEGG